MRYTFDESCNSMLNYFQLVILLLVWVPDTGAIFQFRSNNSLVRLLLQLLWTSDLFRESRDSKTLWRRVNCLLQPNSEMINPHSAASFAQFFDSKVADIRAKTANAPPPTIVSRDVPSLATFREYSSFL